MPKRSEVLGNPIPLRLDRETEVLVDSLAELRGESKAEVMRSLIKEGARAAVMQESSVVDELLRLIRRAVQEQNRPFEDRVAKLMAKAAQASATAMYTNVEVLGQLGRRDVVEIYNDARKKGVAYVRASDDTTESEG